MRTSSSTAAICLVLLAAACSRPQSPAAAAAFVPPTGTAARVYGAVLDSLVPAPANSPMVVAESSVVFRAPAGVPIMWPEYGKLPSELPLRLEQESQQPLPSARLSLPRPVLVLTRAEFDAIKASQPKAWWTEFARRYPGQRQVLAFSPIAFTRDSTVALMEFVFGCGDSCGGGHLVWLERGAGDRWMIRRVYPIWLN